MQIEPEPKELNYRTLIFKELKRIKLGCRKKTSKPRRNTIVMSCLRHDRLTGLVMTLTFDLWPWKPFQQCDEYFAKFHWNPFAKYRDIVAHNSNGQRTGGRTADPKTYCFCSGFFGGGGKQKYNACVYYKHVGQNVLLSMMHFTIAVIAAFSIVISLSLIHIWRCRRRG